VDEEGGKVARIANAGGMDTTVFPPMAEIGRTEDPGEARKVGDTIGSEIRELGFNLDFAPVADISTNDLNTEIGTRSFGDDPKLVAKMISEVVKGLQENGVCATLKHFPGQGDSGEDTHRGYVNLDTSIDRLRDMEFVPFKAGIKAGADFVMVSHVAVSNITQNEVPASLSSLMVSDILRGELQFENVIITDAMNMKVITKFYDPAQAAVMAVQAGDDMILMPDDFKLAYEGILDAVADGDLTEKDINDAAERILRTKIRRGIISLDSDLLK
jgi:beta-N-acetylhexosaminidase